MKSCFTLLGVLFLFLSFASPSFANEIRNVQGEVFPVEVGTPFAELSEEDRFKVIGFLTSSGQQRMVNFLGSVEAWPGYDEIAETGNFDSPPTVDQIKQAQEMIYREAIANVSGDQDARAEARRAADAENLQDLRDNSPFSSCRNFYKAGITGCDQLTGLPFVTNEVTDPANELGLLLEARELYVLHKEANVRQAQVMKACIKRSSSSNQQIQNNLLNSYGIENDKIDDVCSNIAPLKESLKNDYPLMRHALIMSQAVPPRSWGTQRPTFDYHHDFSQDPIHAVPDMKQIKAPTGEELKRLQDFSVAMNQSFLKTVPEENQRVQNLLNNDRRLQNYLDEINELRASLASLPDGAHDQVRAEIQRVDELYKARRDQLMGTPDVARAVAGKWKEFKDAQKAQYAAMVQDNKLLGFINNDSFDENGEVKDEDLLSALDKVIEQNQELKEEIAGLDTSVDDLEKLYLQPGLVNQVLRRKPGFCDVANKGERRFKDSRFYQDVAVGIGVVAASIVSKPCDLAFAFACQAAIGAAAAGYYGYRQYNEYDESLTNLLYDLDGDGESTADLVSLGSERRFALLNAAAGVGLSFIGPASRGIQALSGVNRTGSRLTGVVITGGDDAGRVITLKEGEDVLVEAYERIAGNPKFADLPEDVLPDYVRAEAADILNQRYGVRGSVMFLDSPYLENAVRNRGLPESVARAFTRDHHGIFARNALGEPIGKVNTAMQVMDDLESMTLAEFTNKYRYLTTDNVFDGLGSAAAIAKNAQFIKAMPADQQRRFFTAMRRASEIEDFDIFSSATRLDQLDRETAALMALNDRISRNYPALNRGDRLPPNLSAAEIQEIADDFNDSFTSIFGIGRAQNDQVIDELIGEFQRSSAAAADIAAANDILAGPAATRVRAVLVNADPINAEHAGISSMISNAQMIQRTEDAAAAAGDTLKIDIDMRTFTTGPGGDRTGFVIATAISDGRVQVDDIAARIRQMETETINGMLANTTDDAVRAQLNQELAVIAASANQRGSDLAFNFFPGLRTPRDQVVGLLREFAETEAPAL